MSLGQSAPAAWFDVPEAERASRCQLTSEQCVIDGRWCFLLGQLEIPVEGSSEPFVWRTWVSVNTASFKRAKELRNTVGREAEPPCLAWVQSEMPYATSTLLLKAKLQTGPVGQRPKIELEPCDHPLAIEQRDGITLERVQQLAESMLHGMATPKV